MTAAEPVMLLLERLNGVKPSGAGWTARCPGHDDRLNSLKIDVGKGGEALIHCHAGCSPDAILSELGWTFADLYPQRSEPASSIGQQKRRIVATYDYPDKDGVLLFQAVRYDPKGFSQRRPDGKGGWIWNLNDTRRVLYRLPELLAADHSGWVLVAAGEKDVDRLTEHGYTATTNPQGEGKWRPEYAGCFAGRRVCVLPDNDDPGEKHAVEVAASIAGIAAEVRLLRLPGLPLKGDVSDWLDAGGTPETLARLIEAAPVWKAPTTTASGERARSTDHQPQIFTADDLTTKRFDDPKWAIDGVIAEGATMLVGAPKKGKSWLLLEIGVAIAAGGRALGKIKVDQGDVLLLCLEDNPRRLQERLLRILDGERAPAALHLVTEWPRLDQGADTALDAWLTEHPNTRLVGIDVLARLRPPSTGNGSLYQLDYTLLAQLKAVADKHQVALVVVHHSRKASADDPLDTISGTAGIGGAADTALILTRERGRADANLYVRGRDVPEADYALQFEPETCRWNLLGDAKEFRLSTERASVVELLRERGPLNPKSIAEALGMNRGNVRVLLHRMRNKGEVLARDGFYSAPPSTPVTGVTPPETRATMRNAPVTPPVTRSEGVTPPVTGKTRATMRSFDPVTPVTRPEGGTACANGHADTSVGPSAYVRVPVA